jgi:hypothetical protein
MQTPEQGKELPTTAKSEEELAKFTVGGDRDACDMLGCLGIGHHYHMELCIKTDWMAISMLSGFALLSMEKIALGL